MIEAVIGLEVHIELGTQSKMFCRCENRFGAPPNTLTCPVCLGLPGALPRPNRGAVERALRLALALGARVAPVLQFDRKHYFYPDLPKGYQISQSRTVLAEGGQLEVAGRRVGIHHLHLEEDAGKLLHLGGRASVDLNRAGVPLVEIVSLPDMHSGGEARAFLEEMRLLAEHLGVAEVRMEEGVLRADLNVSVRTAGEAGLNARTEVKNMNSFRAVERAVAHEVARQSELLSRGERLSQETRGWDDQAGATYPQRRKETADDYRYMPEPDLPSYPLSAEWLEEIRRTMPSPPAALRQRLGALGVPDEAVALLLEARARLELFDQAVAAGAPPVQAAQWIVGELARIERESAVAMADRAYPGADLAELLALVADGTLAGPGAKRALEISYREGRELREVVAAEGLAAIGAGSALDALIDQVLAENKAAVGDLLAGQEKALGFLLGQLMRLSGGRADPKLAASRIRERARSCSTDS